MIGKLTGTIDKIGDDYAIVDVNGVGYLVYCSGKTLGIIQNKKEKISLIIETVVKEDSISLFGFANELEKECFNTLCAVSGVGNKVAIKILTSASPEEIIFGLINKDKTIFMRASGVGEKVAVRIITELGKCSLIKNHGDIGLGNVGEKQNISGDDKKIIMEALSALESLGYQRNRAQPAVLRALGEKPFLTLESVITEALKIINNF